MSYINLSRSVLLILIYLLGYFSCSVTKCILAVSVWFIARAWYPRKTKVKQKEDLRGHHLPAWVLHPDTERSEWINLVIKQLWPFLEAYVRKLLLSLERDEGLRNSLRSYAVEYIRFPSFSLGSIPPRITGVKVHTSVHRKEIILDINMDYAGDSEISVALGVMPPVSKVIEPKGGLQHITIKSNVRLHLAPLLRDSPFVGSVSLSFLDIPEIDFVLNGFIKVLDFPGIEVLLKKFISNYLEQHFVNPNSLKIPIQPQPNTPIALTSQRRLEEGGTHSLATPKGVLRINVLEAKGLQNKDLNLIGSSNKSDPYATLEVQVDSQHHSFKTHVIPNNLHPHWNFTAELIVDDTESLDQILLQIWDKDSSNKDDFLGKCELPLSGIKSAIESGEPYDSWTILEKVQRGSLRTILSWSSLCSNTQLSDKSEDAPGSVGVLVIEIDSCSNLLGGRMTGLKLPNPKVVVELGGISQETEVVAGSIHPVFEHRMSFLVSNPKVDSLKISVMDTRKSLKKPTIFGTLRLNLSGFLGREDLSLLNQQFNLKSRSLGPEKESPSIILSAVFRYIEKRAPIHASTSRCLQELHKRVTSSPSPSADSLKSPQTKTSPPSITLSPPKNLEQSIDDLNNNLRRIDSMKSLDISQSPNIPDIISVSQKYNLHLPNGDEKSPGSHKKLPDYRAKLRLSIKYNSMTKTLSVVVHQGKHIPVFPHSNVGVKMYLLEELQQRLLRRMKHGKRKTKTQKTPEPTFEETLEYYFPEKDILTHKLEVVVELHKGLGCKSIGDLIVDLDPLASHASLTKWYALRLSERFEDMNGFPHKGLTKIKFSPTHSLKVFKTFN